MATSDQEQKSINVPMHKRLAMGEKLDGTSLQAKGQNGKAIPAGGLSHVAKKNK
jgi:hypothetical protein